MMKLIELPYAPNALEPVISAQTLGFHHGKHLQAYVDNLNKLLPGSGLEDKTLEQIVISSAVEKSPAIFNNAGQILNHNMYFTQFASPDEAAASLRHFDRPEGVEKSPLFKQIAKQWTSLSTFQAEFESKGVSLFGSGWVWLSAQADGTLVITQETNAGNPVTKGLKPLLTFDVWEHAYYLDYQNRRAAHLQALWGIVNWKIVEERYK